jgi:glutamine synthetase
MTLDLAQRCEDTGTSFLLALFVDLAGKPCAKLVPVESLKVLESGTLGFAGYAVGSIGQSPSDPELVAVPDPASFTPVPFLRPGLAIVHCDPHLNDQPWPYAPRLILAAAIARARAAGFEPWVGAEVEYFLLARDAQGGLGPADVRDDARRPAYDARSVIRSYEFLTEVSKAMNDLGWGNYANDHEDGNGQFEQSFDFSDALTTADRVITLRTLLSVFASDRDLIATFMPKPFADRAGSGLHLHLSLTSGDVNVMPSRHDSRGLGLSDTGYAFVAGLLEHAPALQAVIAPTVNSYKRTASGPSLSGQTWAPRAPTYGGNDRTHYIRIPDGDRVELRGGDGSANPYLAIAAALDAGLDGIANQLVVGPVGTGPDVSLPPTLLHAVAAFEADPVITATFDHAAPGVAAYFADCKRREFLDWHASVTPWERDAYLTAF